MQQELESIEDVANIIDRVVRKGRFGEFELSNGILLKIKPVPPLLANAITEAFKDPDPPKVYLEEKGRDEENPNDPNYLRELEEINEKRNRAINNLYLGIGTECVHVPDGYYRPEQEEWLDQVKFAARVAGTPLDFDFTDAVERYLCWLRFYALENGDDATVAHRLPMVLGGISEAEVEQAIDSFRSVSERGTDNEPAPTPISTNGNSGNRSDRRSRSRNRGA